MASESTSKLLTMASWFFCALGRLLASSRDGCGGRELTRRTTTLPYCGGTMNQIAATVTSVPTKATRRAIRQARRKACINVPMVGEADRTGGGSGQASSAGLVGIGATWPD